MKPTQLKKDARFSGRINLKIRELLRSKGITAQKIIDGYINTLLKVDSEKVEWKLEAENKIKK